MIKDLILFVLVTLFHLTIELHYKLNRAIRFIDDNMKTDTSTYKFQLTFAKIKDRLDSL